MFGDDIANACLQRWQSVGKKGFPGKDQWTVVAAFVLSIPSSSETQLKVISLGSGTKGVSQKLVAGSESVIRDCHAEALARRSLHLYLYQQITETDSSLFQRTEDGKLCLQAGVNLHFFVTQTPCGDASIFPADTTINVLEDPLLGKRKVENVEETVTSKRLQSEIPSTSGGPTPLSGDQTSVISIPDIQRTGSKPVPGEPADPLEMGAGYHRTGVLRCKPGRGDPCLSHSCSDKIMRWNALGVQGGWLSAYFEPLYLTSITVGLLFNEQALNRALVDRLTVSSFGGELSPPFAINHPVFHSSSVSFDCERSDARKIPCGFALNWFEGCSESESLIGSSGIKQGSTAKTPVEKSRSRLCKYEIAQRMRTLQKEDPEGFAYSYLEQKLRRSDSYRKARASFLHAFPHWQHAS